MRYLGLIVLFLVAKDVISSRCPFETETPYCDCGSLFPNNSLDIKCIRPLLPTITTDQFFLIKLNETEININCPASLDWSNFDYQFSNEVRESNAMMINHCIFEKNMNLIRIAELIRAKNIRELRLKNTFQNDAIDFDDHLFKGFTNLEKLYIMNNENLTQINKNLLLFLPLLTEFHLVNNSLRNLPADLLAFLPRINILRLSNNRIRRLSLQTFKNLGTLKLLDLSQNQLDDLPSELFDSLINLETLLLFSNDLPYIPKDAFSKLENLKHLYLGFIGLGSLLEHTFQNNRKLETLHLQDNYLKVLPNRIFDGLINLQVLKMDNNQLESLAEDIFSSTTNLVTLTLSENNLESFGDLTFRNLMKLKKLDIRSNRLNNLADSAFENRQMEAFLNTSELFSGFQEKYNEFGQKVKNHPLVSLFFNCSNLVYLFLSHNNIDKMYDDWFLLSRQNLKMLDLADNKISELNIHRDLKHKSDFYIDLSHNKIASILPNDFTNINIESTNYVTVNIKENPINCDCHIGNFLRYIKLEGKDSVSKYLNILSDGLKCERPEGLKGLLLIGLKTKDLHCDLPFHKFHNPVCQTQCNVRLRLVHSFNEDPDDTKHHTVESETNMGAIYQFNCVDKNITTPSQEICIAPNTNVELDLTNNYLTTIPLFEIQEDYDAVTKLVLSQNRISSLRGISSFRNLQILEVENEGTLLVLTKDILTEMSNMMYLRHIYLGRSLFMCNDDFFQLMNYRVFSLMSNNDEIGCVDSSLQLIKPFVRHFFRFPDVGQYE